LFELLDPFGLEVGSPGFLLLEAAQLGELKRGGAVSSAGNSYGERDHVDENLVRLACLAGPCEAAEVVLDRLAVVAAEERAVPSDGVELEAGISACETFGLLENGSRPEKVLEVDKHVGQEYQAANDEPSLVCAAKGRESLFGEGEGLIEAWRQRYTQVRSPVPYAYSRSSSSVRQEASAWSATSRAVSSLPSSWRHFARKVLTLGAFCVGPEAAGEGVARLCVTFAGTDSHRAWVGCSTPSISAARSI
jgi:hypothetical protein